MSISIYVYACIHIDQNNLGLILNLERQLRGNVRETDPNEKNKCMSDVDNLGHRPHNKHRSIRRLGLTQAPRVHPESSG